MLFFCLLLYLGVIYVRPAEIVPEWSQFPFAQVASGLTVAVAVFSYMTRPRSFANLAADRCLLAFWLVILLSNLLWWTRGALDGFIEFIPTVFVYFLVRLAIETPRQLRWAVYWLLALSLFQAVNGIVEAQTGVGLGGVVPFPDGRIRGTGIFSDPNDLALTMVMVVPFLISGIFGSGTRLMARAASVAALGPILAAMYYTNSRGGVLGLGATVVAFSYRRLGKFAATVVSATLLIALMAAAPSRASDINSTDESAQSRLQAWAAGWVMLKSNPIVGVGYGRFLEFHERVAHNSFVHTVAELGLLGGVCLVGMFYFYFRGLRRVEACSDESFPTSDRWRRDLLASGAGVVTCCWFLSRQYVPYIWVLLALGVCYRSLVEPASAGVDRPTASDVGRIVMITMVGLVLVNVSVRTMAVWSR